MNKLAFIFLLFSLFTSTFAQQTSNIELPYIKPGEAVTSHTGFTLLYNQQHKQASWVAYKLTQSQTNKQHQRKNNFKADPKITSNTDFSNDYKSSGYDRGHLCPAADMAWSEATMSESFYYSNMSPQEPSFNRGIWKELETLVRSWAITEKEIYIVTGPVLTSSIGSIGTNKITIPKYYYKVIYAPSQNKMIALVLPNQKSDKSLQTYVITVDSLESLTNINFFPTLPDSLESQIQITKFNW